MARSDDATRCRTRRRVSSAARAGLIGLLAAWLTLSPSGTHADEPSAITFFVLHTDCGPDSDGRLGQLQFFVNDVPIGSAATRIDCGCSEEGATPYVFSSPEALAALTPGACNRFRVTSDSPWLYVGSV